MGSQDIYLRAILAILARQAIAPARLAEIIGTTAGEKQHRAFNLCDGTRTQAEVARELGLDPSNFSKTLARWVNEGIVVRIGDNRDARPMHVYPLPETLMKKAAKQ